MQLTKKQASVFLVALMASAASMAAEGNPTGLQGLIAALDFADVVTAIMSIGVLVIGVDLAFLGYMKVRRMVKGAR